jgi:hypothetical protein
MPTMTKNRSNGQAQQNQGPPPGAYFRYPGIGARPRMVEETGPCAPATSVTLQQAGQVNAGFAKFQTLDIDEGFLLELDFATTFNQSTGSLTPSVLFPANLVNLITVQFESAYNTFRLPGFLAYAMQLYRSLFGPKWPDIGYAQNGAGAVPPSSFGANVYSATNPLAATANLAMNITNTQQSYSLFFEVPVSMYFDLYWELGANGAPMGSPVPRAIVSPQRMAATTRNVTPQLTYSALVGATSELNFPATAATITAQTGAGTVTETWFRKAFIPTDNPTTEPPGRFWQYSRDYISYQPSGAQIPAIPIDDSVPGQGQILSLIFCTYDPALNSGLGGFTPYSAYSLVELLYGSNVQIFQQTPKANIYQWQAKHDGWVLPTNWGMMGWDLMLTDDGRLTNENAINTLVVNGTQLRITYVAGSIPSNAATVYIGLEMLKKVGS